MLYQDEAKSIACAVKGQYLCHTCGASLCSTGELAFWLERYQVNLEKNILKDHFLVIEEGE